MSDTDPPLTLVHSADDGSHVRRLAEQAVTDGRITADDLSDDAGLEDMVFSLRALEIEREVNHQQLRNSAAQATRLQQRFDQIFGALPAVSMLIDAAFSRILATNAMALTFFGSAASVGRSFLDMGFDAETESALQHALAQARAQGQAVLPVVTLRCSHGRPHQTRIQFDLIEPEMGGRAQILVQMADLTTLPKDREGLLQSWLWLRLMTEALDGVMPFLVEPGLPPRFRYVSSSFERIWGFAPAALSEKPCLWRAGIVESDRPLWDALMEQGSGVTAAEFRVTQRDGSLRPVQCRLYPTEVPGCLFGFVMDPREYQVADLPITSDAVPTFVRMLAYLTGAHADTDALLRGFCDRFGDCFCVHAQAAVRIDYAGAVHVSAHWQAGAATVSLPLRRDGQTVGQIDMQFSGTALPAHAVSWRIQGMAAVRAEACAVLGQMLQQAIDRI